MLTMLTVAPLVVMLFWLIRVSVLAWKASRGLQAGELLLEARHGYSLGDAATGKRAGISPSV
jgi:hypothetical protein